MKKSHVLVGIQFTIIGAIVAYCGVRGGLVQNAITIAALFLGIWAIATLRFSVNVLPDVRESQLLFTEGPYKFIRHPMYTSVLLATAAWVSNRPDVFSVLLWLMLLADLLIKLRYEESLLTARFPDYKAYSKKAKRLIPFIV